MAHYLDPAHVLPWYYYARPIGRMIVQGPGPVVIVAVAHFAATRWRTATVLDSLTGAWFIVPVILISVITSKQQHYVYPFLPPLALVTGSLIVRSCVFRTPSWARTCTVRWALGTATVASLLVALWMAHSGPIVVAIGETVIFGNLSVLQPLAIGAAFGVGALLPRLLPLVLVLCVPLSVYPGVIKDMNARSQTFTTLRSCLSEVAEGTKARAYFGALNYAHHAFAFYRVVEYADWHPERVETTLFGEKPRAVWVSQTQYRALLARPNSRRLLKLTTHLMHPAAIYAGPDKAEVEVPVLLLPRPFDKCDEPLRRAGSKHLETGFWEESG